jgi:hypothetical protein
MNAPASPVLTARQRAYIDQYNTLRSAEAVTLRNVLQLQDFGGVGSNWGQNTINLQAMTR